MFKVSRPLKMYRYRATPHLEGHNKNKQMENLKYLKKRFFFDIYCIYPKWRNKTLTSRPFYCVENRTYLHRGLA